MLRDFFSKTTYSFSKEDKEKAMETIHRMIALANLTRTYGIEALAEEMEQESNQFLRIAADMLIDGAEISSIRQVLQNLIWAGQYRGHDLLNRLLITEGIIAIHQGEALNMLAMKLSSILGEGYFITESRAARQESHDKEEQANKENKLKEELLWEEEV